MLRLLFLRLVVFSLSRESFLVCQVASIQNLRLVLDLNLENALLVLLKVLLTCGIADSVHRLLFGFPLLFRLEAVFLCFGDSLFFCRKAAFTTIFQIHAQLNSIVYLLGIWRPLLVYPLLIGTCAYILFDKGFTCLTHRRVQLVLFRIVIPFTDTLRCDMMTEHCLRQVLS